MIYVHGQKLLPSFLTFSFCFLFLNSSMLCFFREVPETEAHWFPVALWHLMAVETRSGDQSCWALSVFRVFPMLTVNYWQVVSKATGPMEAHISMFTIVFLCCSFTRGLMSPFIKRSDQVSIQLYSNDPARILFVAWSINLLAFLYFTTLVVSVALTVIVHILNYMRCLQNRNWSNKNTSVSVNVKQ